MTKEQMFAQAVRNRIEDLERGICRAEGAINELNNVLAALEGSSVVGQGPSDGSAGCGGGPAAASPAEKNSGGGDDASRVEGADGEGCTQGTDGGAA